MNTLGVLWLAKEDFFTYKVNPLEDGYPLTKRNFLRKVAMGFLAPYVIRAKILLQEMWTSGMERFVKWKENAMSVARERRNCKADNGNPNTKTFTRLTQLLTEHYESVPIVIAERHKFWTTS